MVVIPKDPHGTISVAARKPEVMVVVMMKSELEETEEK